MNKFTTTLATVVFLIGVVPPLVAMGCTAQQRAAVARTIADIAAEVCVEGDSISVCLKKCETEASRREE